MIAMSVAKSNDVASVHVGLITTSRAIETRKPPYTCTTPFGLPVVPDM